MALSEKKKESLKANLKKSGAMAQEDTFIDAAYANQITFGVGGVFMQKALPGFACFTEEKFIWTGAGDDIVIPYNQIRELDKCLIMLMPMVSRLLMSPHPAGSRSRRDFPS